ncbi:TetR/AcrR family transcriptional regulator [Mycolicibacterium septicum]|uniref:TetR/AcrR family transcriptional regulator n=1 Tax=Mycolicibacterium septicum TaxID=98668 RepID=UPI00235DE873|nr:TetR/AcrR family transcriptional regulator [Mycolicibacterium septicum]
MTSRAPTGAAVLQSRVTGAITEAVLAEWTEKGYARMSMEAVARRAGVGKSALYRRWESKQQMALAVLDELHVAAVVVPDTGSLEGDLHGLMTAMQTWLDYPRIVPIMADLVAETTRDPELSHAVETLARAPYRAQAYEIFDRAHARGELHADVDREVVVELIASIVFWRNIVRGEPTTEEYRRNAITTIGRGCSAG